MQAVLGLLLFSVLLTGGSSLECEVCSKFAEICTGKMMHCDDKNDVCLLIVTKVTNDMFHYEKKCETQAACDSFKNLKGKKYATGRYEGVIDEVVCSKAPSSYASLLLALSGFLLKNILF